MTVNIPFNPTSHKLRVVFARPVGAGCSGGNEEQMGCPLVLWSVREQTSDHLTRPIVTANASL